MSDASFSTEMEINKGENSSTSPQFIREFSKSGSSEERSEAAKEIRAKRSAYFERKQQLGEKRGEISSQAEQVDTEMELKKQNLLALEATLSELPENWFSKTIGFMKRKSISSKIETTEAEIVEIVKKRKEIDDAETQTVRKLEEKGINAELGEARKMLSDFYEREKEKWANAPYSKEDVQKYFSEEHLKSLNLEDYATLMSRFPNHMVTHVTRQGLRDHWGHAFHTAGMWEYSDGFLQVIKDGKLRSAFGTYLKEGGKLEGLAGYLGFESRSKEEEIERINVIAAEDFGPGVEFFRDKSTIHVATEEVADFFYGGEIGNEIFFAFPSAYVASQLYFSGDIVRENPGTGWNDQKIWPKNEGIDINAGLVFIPGFARVDKETGSRYMLDAEMKPIENTDYLEKVVSLMKNPDFGKFMKEIDDGKRNHNTYFNSYSNWGERLKNEFGVDDIDLRGAFLYKGNSWGSVNYFAQVLSGEMTRAEGEDDYEIARRMLNNSQNLYRKAENTISSQEYWENYFKNNPHLKPSKIVYYTGGPTWGLKNWRESNGITKRSDDTSLGFVENDVFFPPNIKELREEFKSIAMMAVDEYYSNVPTPV